jgi:hypothetical protein
MRTQSRRDSLTFKQGKLEIRNSKLEANSKLRNAAILQRVLGVLLFLETTFRETKGNTTNFFAAA